MSIGENYADLADLDPRVAIAWEDAGTIPYSYHPTPLDSSRCEGIQTPEETIDYSRKLSQIRPGSEFVLVPKGWTSLRWEDEFEHHGRFILGRRSREYIRRRLEQRRRRWALVHSLWNATPAPCTGVLPSHS